MPARQSPAAKPPRVTRQRRGVGRPRKDSDAADTRQVILAAAEEVLITVGYANFTTRKVAQGAGIAIGNLTYHFPNKVNLTEALIDYVLARYLEQIRAPLISKSGSEIGAHPLSALLRWTLADSAKPRIGRLCRELWAMACHQKFAARAMDEFYRRMVRAAADVAQSSCPSMTQQDALNITYLMALLSEGAVVLFGTLPEANKLLPGVTEFAVRAIDHLISATGAAGPVASNATRKDGNAVGSPRSSARRNGRNRDT
jgi:AcrR family transcriptional regulator